MQLRERGLSWMFAALLVLTCEVGLAAQREASKKYHFEIARDTLESALAQFSSQTGLQIGTQLNVSSSHTEQAGPFVGHATADEAMTSLLQNSDLSYAWIDARTIRVFLKIIRLPHAEDDIDEVLVTGSRLAGDEGGPAPIRVYSQASIDRYGISSVADLSRYITQQPFSFSGGYFQSNAQFFQMRGLGFDTTLVLINGRRVPPSANSISLNAVDLNSIPVMAVKAVHVLSDAASAIYGADAIGGVVNVILKDRIERPEVYLHFGLADGGGTQRRAALSLGGESDRLKSTVVLDYYETSALMGEERDLWNNQDYRRFGGRDYRVSTSNPGNVYSLTSQPLPGLSSSRAAVPLGAATPLTSADFIPTDGVMNLEALWQSGRSYRPLIAQVRTARRNIRSRTRAVCLPRLLPRKVT